MRYEILLEVLEESVDSLSRALKYAKGKLSDAEDVTVHDCCNNQRNTFYIYDKKIKKRKYCPADSKLLKKVAQADYYRNVCKRAEKQLKLEKKLLKELKENPVEGFYSRMTDRRQKIVNPLWLTDELFAKQWQNKEYNPNSFECSNWFLTKRGERVRSKTEKIIADMLYDAGIPYFYEMPVVLGKNRVRYPDFTILNKRTHKVYYLEHLGMMDDPEYRMKAWKKTLEYSESGYVLGDNLLFTFEEKDFPFDAALVSHFIDTLFV